MFRKFFLLFLLAFVLNVAWEFAHSVLYVNYQGGEITKVILLRASLWDAVFITLIVAMAYLFKLNRALAIIIGVLLVSIVIELWAQSTGRWIYSTAMPLIPILNIGLTPTTQLALTGYLAQKFVFR
jgi:hypothetical protein